MSKKKRIIISIIGVLILIGVYAIYWDQTRCYEIQNRCTPYDLTTVENLEDIDFYRGLNEKCMGKCGTAKLQLKIKKRWCRYEFKQHKEGTKNNAYKQADTYNPCPKLYTLQELNSFLEN